MLDVVLVLVVAAHLLAVNVALAGPFMCLWLQWRHTRPQGALAGEAGRWLLRWSLLALAPAVALGLAALGLLWMLYPGAYFEAARQVPARRYWFGIVELVFSAACLGLWLCLWPTRRRPAGRARLFSGWSLGLLAATNLLYHFPPLFAVIGVLSSRPQAWGKGLPFTRLMVDPEVLARTLHHILAAAAVAGAALMLYALRPLPGASGIDRRRAAAWGGRSALLATLLQLPAGWFVLMQLPAETRNRLLGQDLPAAMLFGASILTTIALLYRLATVSWGGVSRREILVGVACLALTVFLMVAARHRARQPIFSRLSVPDRDMLTSPAEDSREP